MSAGSVLAQSYRDLELIVVDDGSDEDVAAAVAELNDPRARCVRRAKSGGCAAARNTGVENAVGRYLAFQDSDDEWLVGKLDRQVSAIENSSPSMSICGLIRNFGHHARLYQHRASPNGTPLTFAQIALQPRAYTQTWLVPRTAVVSAGGFDERLRIWDDWELLLRLSREVAIRPLEEPLAISNQLPDSISRETERFWHDLNLILGKHATELKVHPRSLANLQRVLGRLSIAAGDLAAGRRAFSHSVRLRPRAVKSWGLLMATLLGLSVARRAISTRRHFAARGAFP